MYPTQWWSVNCSVSFVWYLTNCDQGFLLLPCNPQMQCTQRVSTFEQIVMKASRCTNELICWGHSLHHLPCFVLIFQFLTVVILACSMPPGDLLLVTFCRITFVTVLATSKYIQRLSTVVGIYSRLSAGKVYTVGRDWSESSCYMSDRNLLAIRLSTNR